MGKQEWKGGTILMFLSIFICGQSFAEESLDECNVQPCWEEYQKANTYYQADVPGVDNPQARMCTVLRTYKSCLTGIDGTACTGSLDYQGTIRFVQTQFVNNNCTEDGPVYPEGPHPVEPTTPCKFKGKATYTYCSLFGDPHLVTFGGEQATCRLAGAWPLIDNDFLTVQVTNSPSSAITKAATVTQKVTVIVKGRGSTGSPSGAFCGSREAVFYTAEAGSLPSTFTDGMREYGAYSSIQVNTIRAGEQVEIYMRYIDSTVIIRQINNEYLSVGIRMPEQVLNDTIHDPDIRPLRQLCVHNCPQSEKVNIGQMLTNISSGTSVQKTSYTTAQKTCREQGVTDFFYDSCVFDLLMTGEPMFSSMANSAYDDVKKYASRQPRWSNRTHLEQFTKSMLGNGQQTVDSHISSAATHCSNSSLTRTLLFVYIMHIISLYL